MRVRLDRILLVVIVLGVATITFTRLSLRTFHLPTGGMEKTLLAGDYLAANMSAYGLRMPLTDSIVGARRPQRGDIIVFRFPEDRARLFIKRVVALPGETVAVRGKGVYVDGQLLRESYTVFGGGPFSEPAPSTEPLRPRLEDAQAGDSVADHFGPERVPQEMLFVMGDNRDNSRDSRYWGFLPLDDVRGKVWCIYFSQDKHTGKIRWDRIGQAVH